MLSGLCPRCLQIQHHGQQTSHANHFLSVQVKAASHFFPHAPLRCTLARWDMQKNKPTPRVKTHDMACQNSANASVSPPSGVRAQLQGSLLRKYKRSSSSLPSPAVLGGEEYSCSSVGERQSQTSPRWSDAPPRRRSRWGTKPSSEPARPKHPL